MCGEERGEGRRGEERRGEGKLNRLRFLHFLSASYFLFLFLPSD